MAAFKLAIEELQNDRSYDPICQISNMTPFETCNCNFTPKYWTYVFEKCIFL